MVEERHVEQIDRKRMISISSSSRSDIRFRSSIGSSDQPAFATAMDNVAPALADSIFFFLEKEP
jgi:hypothetical protein